MILPWTKTIRTFGTKQTEYCKQTLEPRAEYPANPQVFALFRPFHSRTRLNENSKTAGESEFPEMVGRNSAKSPFSSENVPLSPTTSNGGINILKINFKPL